MKKKCKYWTKKKYHLGYKKTEYRIDYKYVYGLKRFLRDFVYFRGIIDTDSGLNLLEMENVIIVFAATRDRVFIQNQ